MPHASDPISLSDADLEWDNAVPVPWLDPDLWRADRHGCLLEHPRQRAPILASASTTSEICLPRKDFLSPTR